MSNKSDKPLALKTIFGSLAAIVIAYILLATFSHQVGGNFKNPVYYIVVIILGLLFLWQSYRAYKVANDGGIKDNSSRAYVIAIAVVIIIWAGGWVAGSNEKVAPGSPQMENLR